MPHIVTDAAEPDGTRIEIVVDADSGEVLMRRARAFADQPAAIRRRDEALVALTQWREAEDARAFHVAQGQAYYDQRAPGAGLPTGAAAYGTATTFVTNVRDKAWERALAAINEWRQA